MAGVTPVFDRYQAENAVIGSLLVDERAVASILAAVDPADILDPVNLRIFQAARALFMAGTPVDPVTIRDKLGKESQDRLIQLMEVTPTSANWREYADIMREQAALTRIRDIADELRTAPTLEDCRGRIAALGELLGSGKRVDSWTLAEAYRRFMADQSSEQQREYIGTGFRELDGATYTEAGDVVIIGGEPSSGKTAFALAAAYHMAKERNVGFFSLETGQKKLTERLVSTVLGVNFNAIKRQQLRESDWRVVAEGGEEFTSRRLTLIRSSGMTATQIQAISKSYGFDVVFIDYVQLVAPECDPRAGVAQAVAGVSRSLHTFAQSTGTLVVELAQLTRPENKSKWYEPGMHDLKETGQLEQDADMILLLYKPKPGQPYLDTKIEDVDAFRVLRVAKQKEGQLVRLMLYFDGARQRFVPIDGPASMAAFSKILAARRNRRAAQARASTPVEGQLALEEADEDGTEPF